MMENLSSCARATRLASDALERQLSFLERIRLRLHLAMCRSCSNCKHEMDLLHRTLSRLQEEEFSGQRSMSEQDREAISHALQELTAQSPRH